MATKRKAGDEDPSALTGREKKKQRTNDARNIDIQSPHGSLPNSMSGLPSTIDVEKFVEARAFEVSAMDSAMKSARANVTQRVWQTLPRHLRRRAASHDFRRVPVRLRMKAKLELEGVKKSPGKGKKAKRGKQKRIGRTESLLRRQRDKSWLETHIWHAKRMKMKNLWGYRLALHPTEKSFRPSYRAAVNGSIIHDASYFSMIEIKGKQSTLKTMLKMCCDPAGLGVAAARYTSGARAYETHLYKSNAFPVGLLGPATVLWRPLEKMEVTDVSQDSKGAGKRKGSRRSNGFSNPEKQQRTVWLRCHPAMFDEAQVVLQDTAACTLDHIRRTMGTPDPTVPEASETIEIVDLRGQINAFEIMGPKSTSVLMGVLDLVKTATGPDLKIAWEALRGLQAPGAVPRGVILGLKVHDPRLSFPPKSQTPTPTGMNQNAAAPIPSATIGLSDLWDQGAREKIQIQRFKNSELNERRRKQRVPGTRLIPNADDDRVPCLLIQRSIGPSPRGTTRSTSLHSSSIHGWTLLVPAGWSMPFFTSLIHTGSRTAGLRERAVQHFEGGASDGSFPEDYVTTSTYAVFVEQKAEEDRARWERTPPAKRFNYAAALGSTAIEDVWAPNWYRVLGLSPPASPASLNRSRSFTAKGQRARELIPTQPLLSSEDMNETSETSEDAIEVDIEPGTLNGNSGTRIQPWLFRGSDTTEILQVLTCCAADDVAQVLFDRLVSIRTSRGFLEDLKCSPSELWCSALIGVRVHMLGRGSPEDLAIIYHVDGEELLDSSVMKGGPQEALEDQTVPPQSAIIGYVTTGNFSLSQGRGHAVGTVSLASFVGAMGVNSGSEREPASGIIVKIRNRDSLVCRFAKVVALSQ